MKNCIEYRILTEKDKKLCNALLVFLKIFFAIVVLIFLSDRQIELAECFVCCTLAGALHFITKIQHDRENTFYLLTEEGVFAQEGRSSRWAYYCWEDIKSAYYRKGNKEDCLVMSLCELNRNQVKKIARRAFNAGRIIDDQGAIVILRPITALPLQDNGAFEFIESKLDCISSKWYDIFAEADNP